jgi:hypothetical protein
VEGRKGWRTAHQCLFCEVPKGNAIHLLSLLTLVCITCDYFLLLLWNSRKQSENVLEWWVSQRNSTSHAGLTKLRKIVRMNYSVSPNWETTNNH